MKLISWNVNGVRSILQKGLDQFIAETDPDILCLQEIKSRADQVPREAFPYPYAYWHSAQRPGYSGTAIFCKQKPLHVEADMPLDRTLGEGRVLVAEFADFFLVNTYTPNARDDLSRLDFRHQIWDPAFLAFLNEKSRQKPLLVCGDLNVAHQEIDLARPRENQRTAGFTPQEREGFVRLLQAGYLDTFRLFYPNVPQRYSWWSYRGGARARNVGWRIDYVLASPSLQRAVQEAFIQDGVMGSDHAPVGVVLGL